jgi:hypothetical protein
MKLAAKFIIYMLAEDNAQTIGAGGEPTAIKESWYHGRGGALWFTSKNLGCYGGGAIFHK